MQAGTSSPKGRRRSLVASVPAPSSSPYASRAMPADSLVQATLQRSVAQTATATSRVETVSGVAISKTPPTASSSEWTAQSSLRQARHGVTAFRAPELVVSHLTATAAHRGASNGCSPGTQSPLTGKAAVRTREPVSLTPQHTGVSTASHTPLTPGSVASSGPSCSPHILSSPSAAARCRRVRHNSTSSALPSSTSISAPCALYDLHHALQHRLVEDLGWTLHWFLDTETEIKQNELVKALEEKVQRPSRAQSNKATTAAAKRKAKGAGKEDRTHSAVEAAGAHVRRTAGQERSPTGGDALSASDSAAPSPRYSDPNTPQYHRRLDVDGRELPFAAHTSTFGVVHGRGDCFICRDIFASARPEAPQAPLPRQIRSPFEYRLASLQRWLRKRSTESASDGLLASCLSLEAQRYMAYLGLADCWTSLFVTAGLPALAPEAVASSPKPSCKTPPCLPTTLSGAASRLGRVPLSFYVLPALCRWKCVTPFRRDRILRESVMHPFPISEMFARRGKGASPPPLQGDLESSKALPATADVSHSLPQLTFFTIQERSLLSGQRRSSIWRSQMATLGESCACDVYLVAATARGSGDATATPGTVTSVWGYVRREDVNSRALSLPSSPSAAAQQRDSGANGSKITTATPAKSPPGELFYIASSLENYLRVGLVLGWVYGWQLCFSSAGPPPNSVQWLRFVNNPAYEAALAANKDTAP
ncbi:hypothetical protein LSCM1_01478 [Leishmania martiniquensis]|uniref:Uncharacterized protein n=1 Tax=Leishmania martiniquensis TaxID=1580590 RepID=A0A836KCK6_9TRYP|nr:hypothetical protein LSCM1_01478 [Leishmania martiniquensis]